MKRATRKEDGKQVAVKIINKFKHRHDLDLIRDEVAVMRAVKGHPHGMNLIHKFKDLLSRLHPLLYSFKKKKKI